MSNHCCWSEVGIKGIKFPQQSFERLLEDLDWNFLDWFNYWIANDGETLANTSWPKGVKQDWIWGLALPLLSEIKRISKDECKSSILGISALPGCGKSSLGSWLETSSNLLNLPINVISLDDFYLPGEELAKAMDGNPWNVPRALPGSHEIKLLEDTIINWKETGDLLAPQFDKALRAGLGDRSGWIKSKPQVLILEGWFLGCKPIYKSQIPVDCLEPSLTSREVYYREKIQDELIKYETIWKHLQRTWHIKALDFSSTCKWKIDQETKMFELRGSSLKGDLLNSFVRMIQASIPQYSLNNLDSDVVIKINESREVLWAGRTVDQEPSD